MESEGGGVSLPLFHEGLLMPWKDLRRGDCCTRFESVTDGFYCKICDFFVHKKCTELSESIQHPSHPAHALTLGRASYNQCDSCGKRIGGPLYSCGKRTCDFEVDLCCAKYPPPEVVDLSETHCHKLTLFNDKRNEFQCAASTCMEKDGFRISYKCHECDLDFHVYCVWNPPYERLPASSEVNHSYHSLHSLKLLTASSLPHDSDAKCRLCGRKVDEFCYHCFSCNFTLDMCCVLNPPPRSLLDLKAHGHQLNLLPRLDSFTCNACGLSGDRSPYVCLHCDFLIHQDCIGLPRVININRHDHRVSRVSVFGGVVNSVCGVCRQKVDRTYGGYSCKRCPPGYVVHSKCATRKDVWNGKELDGVPEKIEDTKPYLVIDENTIHHFSHEEHYLRFQDVSGFRYGENKRCKACTQPISLQSFYGCMDCDFFLHEKCAELPKWKRHVLHNEQLTLVTNVNNFFRCDACDRETNGFAYKHGRKELDVICSSISEPFVHPSHPHHPLYYIPTETRGVCNGCKEESRRVLRCVEKDCGFILDFKCATLPQMLKHRVDDHPLSLCYGEEASGKYWCYICEKETNPEKWFYTCKDQWASLHTKCVLGDFARLMPGSIIEDYFGRSCEVVMNNSAFRPFCGYCKLHCIYPIILKRLEISDKYFCSWHCANMKYLA